MVLEVLRHLARYWAPVPPARGEERRRSVSRISVIHNFDESSPPFRGHRGTSLRHSAETWTCENEARAVTGPSCRRQKATGSRSNAAGRETRNGAAWAWASLRRLSAYDLRQRYVGIQVFSKGATVVKLALPIPAASTSRRTPCCCRRDEREQRHGK